MKDFNVFISYRREDGTQTAQMLYDFLTEQGLTVFFDTQALVDGHRFNTQITTALIEAPHYILIGSPKAFRFREGEDWVRRELTLALDHYTEGGNRTITVLLPDGTQIPEKSTLPEDLQDILDFQIISGTSGESMKRVLKVVTAVNHANLWHASCRWLEQQKQPGGRFCDVAVDENLLPCVPQQLPTQVICDSEDELDLPEAVRKKKSHLFLIGPGGIGKTTVLLKMMNDAYEGTHYSEHCTVPIFVELSSAPDTYGRLYHGGSSSFIRRSIYRQLRADRSIKQVSAAAVEELDSAFCQPYEAVVEPVDDLLAKQESAPQYLLLLDGLNEISTVLIEETQRTVAEMVIEEILRLARYYPNVRLVLTSRSNEQALQEADFVRLELEGVSEYTIYQYLMGKKCHRELSPEMLEILRIPLFLIMYAELSSVDNICTQGEILHRFFSRPKTKDYTMQSRVDDVARSIQQSASAVAKTRIEPQMHRFLLDFVLPEIGWYMEQQELFHISGQQLCQVIWKVLDSQEPWDICGAFGMDAFPAYHFTATVAKKLIARLGTDRQTVCRQIINLLTFTLGVLKDAQPNYTFTHQHIRDYFAARKGINTLTVANCMRNQGEPELAYQCVESVFGQRPPDPVVRRFMGEILQEHRNVPIETDHGWALPPLTGERALISNALDIYEHCFPGGKGIAVLVSILKEVRKNLAGCDFSRRDLSGCHFSGAILSADNLQADFTQSLISGETLLHTGHTSYINTVSIWDDGRYVITGGDDGKVLRYNSVTGNCCLLAKLEGPVWFAQILSDGCLLTVSESHQRNLLFVACEKILVQRINLFSAEVEKRLELPNESLDVRLSADEKVLLIRQCGILQVINPDNLQLLQQHTFSQNNMIAEFLGNSYEVLLSDGSTIQALTGEKGQFLPPRQEDRFIWRSAVRGNTLCTMTQEGKLLRLEVYHLKSKKCLASFTQTWRNQDRAAYHVMMHNGAKYYNLVFSDQGRWLALITPNDVYLYETKQWQLRQCLPDLMGQYINDVAFCDRDHRIAIGTLDGGLFLCETAGFTPVLYCQGLLCRIEDVDLSASGEHLITHSADGMLRCWNLQTGSLEAARSIGKSAFSSAVLTEGGARVLVKTQSCQYYTMPDLQPCTEKEALTGYYQISEETGIHHPIHIHKDGSFRYTVYGANAQICAPYLFVEGRTANNHCVLSCYDLSCGQLIWWYSQIKPMSLQCVSSRYLITREEEGLVIYDSATGDCLGRLERTNDRHTGQRLYADYLCLYSGYGANHCTEIYHLPEGSPVYKATEHICLSQDLKWAQIERVLRYGQRQLDIYYVPDRSCVVSFPLPAAEIPMISGERAAYTPMERNRFAVCRSAQSVCVYQVTEGDVPDCSLIGEFTIEPGLDIIGLDLSDLHPDSRLTPRQAKTLRAYGAIL